MDTSFIKNDCAKRSKLEKKFKNKQISVENYYWTRRRRKRRVIDIFREKVSYGGALFESEYYRLDGILKSFRVNL